MPRNRRAANRKRETEMTPVQLLKACGPSDAAMRRLARIKARIAAQQARHLQELDPLDRYLHIGGRVREIRQRRLGGNG
jgi:hypothetical protein